MSKRNRSTLKDMCLRLFSDYNYVKVTKKTVYLKRRWYSLEKVRIQVVDLVLLRIPQAINELYEECSLDPIFKHMDDLATAVEYFEEQEDIIQHLKYQIDDLDMSVELLDNYSAEPSLLKEKEQIVVEETYVTKKLFMESVVYYYSRITDVIEEIHRAVRTVHINTESACNSPPIRAPGLKVA